VTTAIRHRPAGTASGAEQEFREFVQGIAAPLHRTAFLLCGDWYLADDLVQETLAKAYAHWRRVRQADNPSAYVRRILVNESRRHWRRHRNAAVPADDEVADIAVPDLSDRVVSRADLVRALQTLPLRQRATVVLRFVDRLSERETAAAGREPVDLGDRHRPRCRRVGETPRPVSRSGSPTAVATPSPTR
jgi:RNA polymerase sigma factor (sigma-70 family)